MAYNRFTLNEAMKTFQLQTDETQDLFSTAKEVKISDHLAHTRKKCLFSSCDKHRKSAFGNDHHANFARIYGTGRASN